MGRQSPHARVNYLVQGALYFPLAGYFSGDRRGPFCEVRAHRWKPLELYGSASQYRNNLENDANATALRSSSVSAGVNASLPWKLSATAPNFRGRLLVAAREVPPFPPGTAS